MKHLLYTHCNRAKGRVLIEHWLFSVKQHVTLESIDLMVVDFGLSDDQRAQLRANGVIIWPAKLDGRWSNIQYRELAAFLDQSPVDYDQVVYSDCGDIVFQADIRPILDTYKDQIRAVIEPEFGLVLHGLTLGFGDVRPDKMAMIHKLVGSQNTVNGGFVVGPAARMRAIWNTYTEMCSGTALHGTDQLILNYILRRDGFVALARQWNYVTFLNSERFYYDADRFLCDGTGRIPVVHNAGRYDCARAIADFGYRRGRVRSRVFLVGTIGLYHALARLSLLAALLKFSHYSVR
jgi:hypothetical protein